MDVYRISCADCDMKDKLRITESVAVQTARKHASVEGHRARVRDVGNGTEVVVTEEGIQEVASLPTPSEDD